MTNQDVRIVKLIQEKGELKARLAEREVDLKREEAKTKGVQRLLGLLDYHIRNTREVVTKAQLYDEVVAKTEKHNLPQTNPHMCGLFCQDGNHPSKNTSLLCCAELASLHKSHPSRQDSGPIEVSESSIGGSATRPANTDDIEDESGFVEIQIAIRD